MKKYLTLLTVVIAVVLLPTLAIAEDYRNFLGHSENHLQSAEGLNMIIKGLKFESGQVGATQKNTDEEIQILVRGANVPFDPMIRAVLTPNCRSGEFGWPIAQATLYADLVFKTDGSTAAYGANFAGSILTHSAIHGGEWINCQPELSVVIDGIWQTDPINGTHNFKLTDF